MSPAAERGGEPGDVVVGLVRLRPRERRDKTDVHPGDCRRAPRGPLYSRLVDKAVIQVRANGPYKITGPVMIVDSEGREFEPPPGDGIVLCRCGHSANKPFCDASHRRVGFVADDSARLLDER